ncbi:MAG: tRNA pseudouridine(13) synthase TruD [Candidatus Methanospirareceae archaeon]
MWKGKRCIEGGSDLKEGSELEKKIGIWFYSTKTDGIGGVIKSKPSDFCVREITNRKEGDRGKYLIVELTKENWDTHLLVKEIARSLRISKDRIGFAGMKDKFAVTTQKISIKDVDDEELKRVKIANVKLKKVGRSNKPVSLGDLYGNEFEVVIRDVNMEKGEIEDRVERITKEIEDFGGVPNFFGVQRFGINRPITHIVGKHLIKGEIEEAVISYIGEVFPGESEEAKEARMLCKQRNFKESLRRMPKFLHYERALLDTLVKSKGSKLKETDYIHAFKVLPKKLQRLFVHAYQAYLFNLLLSYRMEEGLPFNEALVGDIVCFRNEAGFADVSKVEEVTEDKIEGINRLIKKKRAFITAPLFGYDTKLAKGKEGEIERRVLEEEGVALSDFIVKKIPEIGSKGTRRPILAPVEINSKEISDDEDNVGKNKVRLRFFLPKGSYATVVLREYMK